MTHVLPPPSCGPLKPVFSLPTKTKSLLQLKLTGRDRSDCEDWSVVPRPLTFQILTIVATQNFYDAQGTTKSVLAVARNGLDGSARVAALLSSTRKNSSSLEVDGDEDDTSIFEGGLLARKYLAFVPLCSPLTNDSTMISCAEDEPARHIEQVVFVTGGR